MPSFPPFLPSSPQTSLSGAEIDRVVDAFTEDGAITMQYLIDADYTEDDLVRARPPSIPPSLPPSHIHSFVLAVLFLCAPFHYFLLRTLTRNLCFLPSSLPPSLPPFLS